jgi:hypothetical protein
MSTKYSGGFITKSPVAPTSSAASGIWTLDQQQQAQKAGTWPSPPIFIEDLFSTWVYAGSNSATTITNGIDLAGKGGLVWSKGRTGSADNHLLIDTARGVNKPMRSNEAGGEYTETTLTAFNSNGYNITGGNGDINLSGRNYVGWTFAKQPKFFDIVTYTGDGVARTIAHNLGSTPGCMIIKRTDSIGSWAVYHRSLAVGDALILEGTNAAFAATYFNSTAPTSTVFSIGAGNTVNASGGTYVAYLFAHDAGGFPVSGGGSTNGISCGSFTTDGSGNATVNLGYEPQWLMTKVSSTTGGWRIFDTMRGWTVGGNDALLVPNTSSAEYVAEDYGNPTATGMNITNHGASLTWIYIAIRRGPMKTPTVGTSVFAPITYTGSGAGTNPILTTNFPVDMTMFRDLRTGSVSAIVAQNTVVFDRLRSNQSSLTTSSTAAQDSSWGNAYLKFDSNTQIVLGTDTSYLDASGANYVNHNFGRAPGFFDEVCYTGTGSTQTLTHNLGVAPEMMIVKRRNASGYWLVYSATIGATKALYLNDTSSAVTDSAYWNNTPPTSTVFTVNTDGDVNAGGGTYVAYLFATCPGVSKVGSYTGNGSTQTIDCGFTGGARFVLIKRTDASGDWYVYDTARGMTVLTDPYLLLNSTAAEVATLGSVTTVSTGFALDSTILAAINVTSATYIFLAIA